MAPPFDIVPYRSVLEEAESLGLECVYPNGGSFAPVGEAWHVAGWITGDDVTVRPAFADRVRRLDVDELPAFLAGAVEWLTTQPTWLMPVHHWAAELDHGSTSDGRSTADLFPDELAGRTVADAVVLPDARAVFELAEVLLPRLWKTDFTLMLPGVKAYALLHHHGQVWWRCADEEVATTFLRRDS
ncbi:MAG: hypothetical protein AAGI46_07955 [Planctomycetota bacterium]